MIYSDISVYKAKHFIGIIYNESFLVSHCRFYLPEQLRSLPESLGYR